jgi:hypothetical protein
VFFFQVKDKLSESWITDNYQLNRLEGAITIQLRFLLLRSPYFLPGSKRSQKCLDLI